MEECKDTPGYVDPNGYGCHDWGGQYDCETFGDYSDSHREKIIENCPLSCGYCTPDDDAGEDREEVTVIVVSDQTVAANFGGLDEADEICRREAQQDGRGNNWRAFLSDRNTAVKSKISQGDFPIYVVSASNQIRFFAGSENDLWNAKNPLPVKHSGGTSPSKSVWTGTKPNGAKRDGNNGNCKSWTSTSFKGIVGSANDNNWKWLENLQVSCNTKHHLYCIGKTDKYILLGAAEQAQRGSGADEGLSTTVIALIITGSVVVVAAVMGALVYRWQSQAPPSRQLGSTDSLSSMARDAGVSPSFAPKEVY